MSGRVDGADKPGPSSNDSIGNANSLLETSESCRLLSREYIGCGKLQRICYNILVEFEAI